MLSFYVINCGGGGYYPRYYIPWLWVFVGTHPEHDILSIREKTRDKPKVLENYWSKVWSVMNPGAETWGFSCIEYLENSPLDLLFQDMALFKKVCQPVFSVFCMVDTLSKHEEARK